MKRSHPTEVIYIEHEDTFKTLHPGVDIARNRNVNEAHRTAFASTQKELPVFSMKNGARCCCGAYNDVGPMTLLIEVLEPDYRSVQSGSDIDRSFVSPVDHRYCGRAPFE